MPFGLDLDPTLVTLVTSEALVRSKVGGVVIQQVPDDLSDHQSVERG